MNQDDRELHITPLYVLNELKEHAKECSKRWWAVMMLLIANLVGLVIDLLAKHP